MLSYERAFHIFPKVKVILSDEAHITGRTATAQKIIYSCQNASIHIGLSATPDRIDNPAEQLRLYSILGPIIYKKNIKEQQDDNFISKTKVELHKIKFPDDAMIEVTGSYNDVYEKTKLSKAMIRDAMRELAKIDGDKLTIKDANAMLKIYYDEDKRCDEVDAAINYICDEWEKEELHTIIKQDGEIFLRKKF